MASGLYRLVKVKAKERPMVAKVARAGSFMKWKVGTETKTVAKVKIKADQLKGVLLMKLMAPQRIVTPKERT
jgi:hypothetical protein